MIVRGYDIVGLRAQILQYNNLKVLQYKVYLYLVPSSPEI